MKIYIATHKKAKLPKKEEYVPLQVGAALNKDLGYLKDNVGDNISEKNPNYCELTGLYYVWKNEKEDIVGLTHYRRYFFKNIFKTKLEDVIGKEYINNILNRYDIILPKREYFKHNIKKQYESIHKTDDLEKCGNIIKKYHKEYYDSFTKIMSQKHLYCYNMFIMKKENFDSYMKWLFDIFKKLEKEIDISSYSKYNQRVYGFLSERLFNVWLDRQQFKIKELPVYNVEDKKIIQIKEKIKNTIKHIGV